jgi:hypothetical protein
VLNMKNQIDWRKKKFIILKKQHLLIFAKFILNFCFTIVLFLSNIMFCEHRKPTLIQKKTWNRPIWTTSKSISNVVTTFFCRHISSEFYLLLLIIFNESNKFSAFQMIKYSNHYVGTSCFLIIHFITIGNNKFMHVREQKPSFPVSQVYFFMTTSSWVYSHLDG